MCPGFIVTTTACGMGQTRSGLSHSAAPAGRTKRKADESAHLPLCVHRRRSEEKRLSGHSSTKPMKNKVLLCLGRRKRDSGQTEADCGGGNTAPATTRCEHRVGKLPRDAVVSAAEEQRSVQVCLGTPNGLDDHIDFNRGIVIVEPTSGSSDEFGSDQRPGEVGGAGSEDPKPVRGDNASDSPARAMEEQPLGGSIEDRIKPEVRFLTRSCPNTPTSFTPDPDFQQTLTPSLLDQPLDRELSITKEQTETEMTKTDLSTASCPPLAVVDQNNCCGEESNRSKDSVQNHRGTPSFPGTIPKLIITRDPSPSRSQGNSPQLTVPTDVSSCLEPHADVESPCSDSGCGGSPALMRSLRKMSNSSSIGLSSASSFEESEDDFTGSDIESSLSPARSLCSPDDGPVVSLQTLLTTNVTHTWVIILP